MKAFVIMFNRLEWPKAMCEYLTKAGCEVILMDNGSTYGPLKEWYKDCPYKIHFLTTEFYNRGLWQSGILKEYDDKQYILTDPDLDLSSVPLDFVSVLQQGLANNPDVMKSGLSLRIDDLPDNDYTREVVSWEKKWWEKPKDKDGFFMADVDTTLALYDSERVERFYKDGFFLGVRSPEPYVARHLPWYSTQENLSEDEKYYLKSVIGNRGQWSHRFKELKP